LLEIWETNVWQIHHNNAPT